MCAMWFRGTFYIQYETLEELGEGAFGKALKCRRRRDNQIFVVKIMHESKMSAKAIEEVPHPGPLPSPPRPHRPILLGSVTGLKKHYKTLVQHL